MQCHEFEDRLNEVLDERGDPGIDAGLLLHAGECEPCRVRLAGARVLLRGLRKRAVPVVRADFAARAVAQAAAAAPAKPRPIAAVPAKGSSRIWLAAGVLVASAAASLLAISLVWAARRGNVEVAREGEQSNAPAVAQNGKRPRRALGTILPGPRSANQRPAMTGGEWLVEAPRLPAHLRSYRGAINTLAVNLPHTAQQLNQMEHLAPGFRPLRLSLEVLWDTLCRTFPAARWEDPSEPPKRTSDCGLLNAQLA